MPLLILHRYSLFAQNMFRIRLDAGYAYTVMNSNQSNLVDSKYGGFYGLRVISLENNILLINFNLSSIPWMMFVNNNLFTSSTILIISKNSE